MNIVTNNQPRQPMSGLMMELFVGVKQAAKIRKEFDWLSDEDFEDESFVTYKGCTYAVSEFVRVENEAAGDFAGWHGYHSDSYFSGVLIRFCDDSSDVIMGRFFS